MTTDSIPGQTKYEKWILFYYVMDEHSGITEDLQNTNKIFSINRFIDDALQQCRCPRRLALL